ncbi:hypothetical protein FRB98_004388 [Tulasnella sp. 332]|nr:hypothetical protein FRB98_004388 [Tulasnella sp. 332]
MSIRSRVRAFEEAAAASEKYQKPLSPRTSLTFSSDDGLTATSSSSAPASPVASSVLEDLDSFVLTGTPSSSSPSPKSFSSASAHTKSTTSSRFPLISFADPSPPRPSPSSVTPITKREQHNGIGIGTPSAATMMPPLPPRRQTSTSSLRAASLMNQNGSVGTPALPPRSPKPLSFNGLASSDSLTIDQPFTIISPSKPSAPSSYAPRHAHASSTSSFHSLSLSDGGDGDGQNDEPNLVKPAPQRPGVHGSVGVGGGGTVARKVAPPIPDRPSRHTSYGSATSSAPTTAATVAVHSPPPIPNKPASIASTSSSASSQPPYQVRRQAPPAPPRPPNSTTTSSSSRKPPPLLDLTSSTNTLTGMTLHQQNMSTRRKTPVPPPARIRYEELFDQQRRLPSSIALLSSPSAGGAAAASRRTHTGWRGISIDLRTNPSAEPASSGSTSTLTEKLHGQVVRRIWLCSKLDKKVLRDIWSECDTNKTGSLDRQAFVQGMWRIDEELTKKALAAASRRKTPVPRTPQPPYAVRR